jgi:hypothetical protein
MLCSETNTAVIGRLRIRSKSPGPQTDRHHLRHVLGNASFSPSGLAASAVLVVRRLEDPLPQRLRVTRFDVQPDPPWQRAVNAELDKLLSQAARPALQAVPAGAVSVLFLDRSELLAALAFDWLSAALAVNWWWREFFRNADPVTAVLKEWTRSPQFVPSALNLLSQRSRAVAFVRRLPQQICSELLQATLEAHAIRWPEAAAFDENELKASDQVTDGRERGGGHAEQLPIRRTEAARDHRQNSLTGHEGPWARWVPEASTPELSFLRKLLLVQALMLARAPQVARTARFQSEVLRWQAGVDRESTAGNFDGRVSAPGQSIENRLKNDDDSQNEMSLPLPELETRETAVPGQLEGKRTHGSAGRSAESLDRETRKGSNRQAPEVVEFAEPANAASDPQDSPEGPVRRPRPGKAADQQTLEGGSTVETSFGGIFFLLNAALILNIYADFTAPLGQNLELNVWDFLALLGSELVGAEIETDPVWGILATLAGREDGQRPGVSFDPPSEWRLPPRWLDAFPEPYESQAIVNNHRLVDFHPAGFPILDLPTYGILQAPPVDPLQRWLGWLTGYLRARLKRATGRDDAVDLLCRQPAHVALTLAHLDVTFSLNRHPFEVRYAGLDRDPGWIPAAGRYVAFHFE